MTKNQLTLLTDFMGTVSFVESTSNDSGVGVFLKIEFLIVTITIYTVPFTAIALGWRQTSEGCLYSNLEKYKQSYMTRYYDK